MRRYRILKTTATLWHKAIFQALAYVLGMISRKVAYVLRKFRLIFAYVLGKHSIFAAI